ncbi:MAG TPA: hypothetical protein PKK10_06985 [Woeseiaceae bacterium]|nr:hypothetical protein [Woeseiaceae bacterium]
MLIRNLVENIRHQNWFVVWIEFLIVVFGVFIGIQVSNWNDARIDSTRARAYLERIQSDIDADILGYQDHLAFWSAVSKYGAIGLDYANDQNESSYDPWELLLAYFQASQVAAYYTTRATYDELKSSGELGLIHYLKLRNALAYYYTNAGNPALTERPIYREHVRGVIPINIQTYIWERCFRSDELGIQTMLDCDAPDDTDKLADVVRAIGSNESLMAELRYWMSTMQVAMIIGRSQMANARRLRDSIQEQLDGQAQ